MLRRGTFVLFVALASATSGSPRLRRAASSRHDDERIGDARGLARSALVREINAVRAAHGLQRLTRSSALTRTAVGHSVAMATLGFFTHESQDGTPFWQRVKQLYVPHTRGWTVGENLAMFGGSPPTATRHRGRVDGVSPASGEPAPRGCSARRASGSSSTPPPAVSSAEMPTWVVTLDVGRR